LQSAKFFYRKKIFFQKKFFQSKNMVYLPFKSLETFFCSLAHNTSKHKWSKMIW